jgi:UDP-N-acetylmuramate dehydrogenase
VDKLEQYLETGAAGDEYFFNHDVGPYLTIGIGGKVKTLVVVRRISRLIDLLRFLHSYECPFIFLGGGSNVVFSDQFTSLPVIVNRTDGIIKLEDLRLVKVDSGVLNKDFISWAIENRTDGFDFLAGIPGTVGGAAAVNAGSFGLSISMVLEKADIFIPHTSEIRTVGSDYFQFSYRHSKFKFGDEVILAVYLRYTGAESDEIRKKVIEKIKYRKEKHPPLGVLTAGCFFKNPIIGDEKLSAGKLIEGAGFKGTVHDRLEVSGMHSNFVVNRGGSTFNDVCSLEEKIIRAVRDERGITLEREVIYISPEGKKY